MDLLVVDVPVIISDKFQQSIVYEDVEVPQIQFIDRVVDFSVVLQRRVRTVHLCAEDRRDPTAAAVGQG